MSEVKDKRLNEITEAILKSRNIGPALGEEEHVSIRDYNTRLLNLTNYANTADPETDPEKKAGFNLRTAFVKNTGRLGYINSLALIKYLGQRIKRVVDNSQINELAELQRIPEIVAGITNGLADSRCMYDFIMQKLHGNYDTPISTLEQEARDFAKSYVPSPIEFNDAEEQQLKEAIDTTCGGDSGAFKRMLIEMKLMPNIKQVLDILKKIEDIENKQAK